MAKIILPFVISKTKFKEKLRNASKEGQFLRTELEQLRADLRNLYFVAEALGYRCKNGDSESKTATYITADKAYDILVKAKRIQRPA